MDTIKWAVNKMPKTEDSNLKVMGLDEIKTAAMQAIDYPSMFAAVMIAVTPMLILFACFQKTIIENTVAGGLKG